MYDAIHILTFLYSVLFLSNLSDFSDSSEAVKYDQVIVLLLSQRQLQINGQRILNR